MTHDTRIQPTTSVTYRLGELFAGAGGIALGAKLARITAGDAVHTIANAWATDYDEDACATYRRNICPDRPETVICHDIRDLDMMTLADISPIDALAFGFPCNDFSTLGRRRGINGAFGALYAYGVRALDIFRPLWFLAENVSGLQSSDSGRAYQRILDELRQAGDGYDVVSHLYKLEQYGIPQARHRIIIVGIRRDLGKTFRIPSPEPYAGIDVSCQNAIENPPIPPDAPNHEMPKHSSLVVERLQYIKPGQNIYAADMPEHLRPPARPAIYNQWYRRLRPDRPAYTVTGNRNAFHWREPRTLTNRERARLQTFPDDFVFAGNIGSVQKQIGMAVPPTAAKIIFEAIMQSLL